MLTVRVFEGGDHRMRVGQPPEMHPDYLPVLTALGASRRPPDLAGDPLVDDHAPDPRATLVDLGVPGVSGPPLHLRVPMDEVARGAAADRVGQVVETHEAPASTRRRVGT